MTETGMALEARSLAKAYGALQVTRDVSFSVPEGAALGIIGPNGAGKTTLFNLIAGATRADSGQVLLYGEDITRLDARQRCVRGIGRSFQVPQPFAGLTVFENLLTAAAYGRGVSERAAHVAAEEALERTGLTAKADHQAGRLTLLDRKRLELARAMATGPKMLLLDEIAGGMTEAECAELVSLIREIHAAGTTIIWIEHVLHALLSVVDSVLVLDFGQVIAEDSADTILTDPLVAAIYLGPSEDDAAREAQGHG